MDTGEGSKSSLLNIRTLHSGHNQTQFDEEYNKVDTSDPSCGQRLTRACQCSGKCLRSCLQRSFPVVPFLSSYKLKSYFFRDLLAGVSIGFMGVPQSLGYARIAKVPEIMGLYTSIFPVIVYFFFTSAKHVSIGTIAIVSLVIRSSIESMTLPSQAVLNSENQTLLNNSTFMDSLPQQDEAAIILFCASYCCAASIILIVMSFLKLGFILSFMSEAFISSFLAANLIRIVVFQYKDMLGVHPLRKHSGILEFFFNSYEIFKESPHANLVSVAMGVITLNILLFFKFYVNVFFRKKFKFPIPVEIIIVIAAIICNRIIGLEEKHNIEILSSIKAGIPQIVMPSPSLMYHHIFDAFLGAVVAFLVVGMMAKLFAHSYGYEVDSDQEMFALGISGLLGCFFSIILPSTAPARCFLMESTGGKTQACHLFTAAFSLFTMLVFASFMRDLPVCVLSSIILAALVPVCRYFLDPFHLYKTNKYDLAIWLVTFCATLVFSVQEGMIIGIGFSLIVVHVWMLKEAGGSVLEKHSNGIFLDRELYPINRKGVSNEVEGGMEEAAKEGRIFIFKFEAPIYFSTLDTFKNLLFNKIPSPTMLKKQNIHIEKMKKKMKKKVMKEKKKHEKSNGMPREDTHATSYEVTTDQNVSLNIQDLSPSDLSPSDLDTDDEIFLNDKKFQPSPLKCLVLDLSAVTLMDTHSAKSLAFLHQEYSKHGVVMLLAACNPPVSHLFHQVNDCRKMVERHLYPSVPDAFIASFNILSSSADSAV